MNDVVCTVDDGEFDWMAACVETEQQHRRWSNFEEEMDQYYLSATGFNVDAVHVLQVASCCYVICLEILVCSCDFC